jgi:kumamolisin
MRNTSGNAPESEDLQPIPGSERRASRAARRLGPADPNELLTVTISIRRRTDGTSVPDYQYFATVHPGQRQRMSEDDFVRQYGASPEDIDKVKGYVASQGLEVLEIHPARRTIVVRGTVAQMNAAFGVDLGHYEDEVRSHRGGAPQRESYRGREGVVRIPRSLADIVVGVFGLDNRRIGKRNAAEPNNTTTVSVPVVAKLYNYPTNSAAGQTIGIFSLSGYDINDINTYFSSLGAGYTAPTVTDILINGATNSGSDPYGETTQDIAITASFAPGAAVNVYITTGDQQGWVQAISRVAHPDATDSAPSVLSSSWFIADGDDTAGLADQHVSVAFVNAVTAAFQDAAIQGITVCIASGDRGTDSDVHEGKVHVQYPGSDPWVLCVGGTTIGNIQGSSFDEYVWNDPGADPNHSNWGTTGGGVSAFFPVPGYQAEIAVPASLNDPTHHGRGVPDVAGNANIASGYSGLLLGGQPIVGNGTSASAPQWAGLIAVLNAALGFNLGFVNPAFYTLGSAYFRDIVPGAGPADNSNSSAPGYSAGPGWDACTGWGSPNGQRLLSGLRSLHSSMVSSGTSQHALGSTV